MATARLGRVALALVPEQVNIPVRICLERGIFASYGVDVALSWVGEGTGKMIDMVENKEVDIALTVTDASMVAKAKGRSIDLCGTFVASPLVWAVATTGKDPTKPMPPKRFGVSRLGSGSHTMAFYYASQHSNGSGKPTDLDFVVANDFKGLREGVNNGSFDYFMWETFTTKPWFLNGELTWVADVPTPWSAFSFIVANDSGQDSQGALARAITLGLFPALQEGCQIFMKEAALESATASTGMLPPSVYRIMQDFGHTREDAELWLSRCRYASAAGGSTGGCMPLCRESTKKSLDVLTTVGLVDLGSITDESVNLLTTGDLGKSIVSYT